MAVAHKAWLWCFPMQHSCIGKVDQTEVQSLFISWRVVRRGAEKREKASPVILVDLILGCNTYSYQYLVPCHNWTGKGGRFGTRSLFYCIIHLLSAYVNSRFKVWWARIEGTIAKWSLSIGRRIPWPQLRLLWLWRERQLQETPQGDILCLT